MRGFVISLRQGSDRFEYFQSQINKIIQVKCEEKTEDALVISVEKDELDDKYITVYLNFLNGKFEDDIFQGNPFSYSIFSCTE